MELINKAFKLNVADGLVALVTACDKKIATAVNIETGYVKKINRSGFEGMIDKDILVEFDFEITDNSFAHACYEQCSVAELRDALSSDADEADMESWGLTADEWEVEIQKALTYKVTE